MNHHFRLFDAAETMRDSLFCSPFSMKRSVEGKKEGISNENNDKTKSYFLSFCVFSTLHS